MNDQTAERAADGLTVDDAGDLFATVPSAAGRRAPHRDGYSGRCGNSSQ